MENEAKLFGRTTIYTSTDVITKDNIIAEVNNAMFYHFQNASDEDYLYWYRRGIQPILQRTKQVRPEINNKVCENIASSIVDFKNGYFLTQPAYYVSRTKESQNKVNILNEYLYRSGKTKVDNKLADWFHTVGRAALYIEPNDNDEMPVNVYALDPRSAFVVYSLSAGNKPVMGIHTVTSGETIRADAFTEDMVYKLVGTYNGQKVTSQPNKTTLTYEVVSADPNVLGAIPIIEYQYNSIGTGAFENAVSLLDALNTAQSNRLDGIEGIIQNLLVLYNCDLEQGTTADTIRKAGLIKLKNVGENKADIKDITTTLDQSQVQVLIDDLYDRILTICAMPSTSKNSGTASLTGAAVMANQGWYQADAAARNTEDLFKESNRLFDEIFIKILKKKGLLDINLSEFEINFVRNETANIQAKAQACLTLLQSGLAPELAFAKSGVSNDPVNDVKMSEKYLKKWETQTEPKENMNAGEDDDDPDAV